MDKIVFRLLTGVFILFSSAIYPQDFTVDEKELISEIKKLMDDDELTDMVEAENSFEEGRYILDQVENEEFTLEKYFEKGSTPKAEKKAVNVKAQRIEAARVYERAYVLIQGAFESRLGKGKWEFDEDKIDAESMRNNSTSKMAEAASKTEDYKYLGEKDLATYPYEDLKKSITDANAMFLEAIHYQFDAYHLLLDQQNKKQKIADDNFAWGIAQRDNNQSAYQKYIDSYPEGIHIDEAKVAIETLNEGVAPNVDSAVTVAEPEQTMEVNKEEITPEPEEKTTPIVLAEPEVEKPAIASEPKETIETPVQSTPVAGQAEIQGMIYRIQFIAVRREMTQEEIASFYSGTEPVSVREEDGLHKYSIGNFSTFKEAREFRKTLSITNFIVAFKDGQRIPINEVAK